MMKTEYVLNVLNMKTCLPTGKRVTCDGGDRLNTTHYQVRALGYDREDGSKVRLAPASYEPKGSR